MTSHARALHIGYLVQDFPPEVGAGPARVTEMAHRWQSLGARVTAVTAMPNRRIPGRGEGSVDPRYAGKLFMEEEWEGIRTLRSWLYTGSGRGFRTKLVNNATFMLTGFLHALARGGHFDVIIASSPPFLPHVSAAVLTALRGTPLVLEIRDLWPDYLMEFGMLPNLQARQALFGLERWLLGRADHTVVVTESFRERVITKGAPRHQTDVIPNGVELSQYYADPSVRERPLFERRPDEFIVGYLGTFGRGQGLVQVIRAAAQVAARDCKVRFVLVGDGPEMPLIRQELTASGLQNVSIHPPIARSDTRAFYNSCDVCLVPLAPIPIFNETVPSKIFEVMACERPLVASVSGEGGQIVERSRGGIRVDPGDADALARAILAFRVMTDTERSGMGRRARAYVAEHYDRTRLADKYLSILTRVAGRPRSTRRQHGSAR